MAGWAGAGGWGGRHQKAGAGAAGLAELSCVEKGPIRVFVGRTFCFWGWAGAELAAGWAGWAGLGGLRGGLGG